MDSLVTFHPEKGPWTIVGLLRRAESWELLGVERYESKRLEEFISLRVAGVDDGSWSKKVDSSCDLSSMACVHDNPDTIAALGATEAALVAPKRPIRVHTSVIRPPPESLASTFCSVHLHCAIVH